MAERESLFQDADIREVCSAATAHAERLRWLGYPEQTAKAANIDAAVSRLVRACATEDERV